LKEGKAVRAMTRNEDQRAQALRGHRCGRRGRQYARSRLMHRVIAGCGLASLSTAGELYAEIINTKII
jgi:hypothetical protein